MREALKSTARATALLVSIPRLTAFYVAAAVIGPERALEGASQSVSKIAGIRGQYLRQAFLTRAGVSIHHSATISFGVLFSKLGAVVEENVYVGPRCHLGLVHLEKDVLLAAGVHVPSGAHSHGTSDVDQPIRSQARRVDKVRIGAGTWVGSGAVVMADVGKNCVIGAGAVVTTAIPDNVVAAGVPARVIRQRPE
ncbi:MAG TPA: acyltransferase [Vicinamibacterales bacterium]|nr:acyltransferase [Vicinamibacterales bacterium]